MLSRLEIVYNYLKSLDLKNFFVILLFGSVFTASWIVSEKNQVSTLIDKEQEVTTAEMKESPEKQILRGQRIDVNKATYRDLMALPGIGPVLAKRILLEREKGRFLSMDSLQRVKGLGVKKIQKLIDHITFSTGTVE